MVLSNSQSSNVTKKLSETNIKSDLLMNRHLRKMTPDVLTVICPPVIVLLSTTVFGVVMFIVPV